MDGNGKVLISIIIPVFNISKYLKRCIDSIAQQTYEPIEIIAVDDGSTDDSYSTLVDLSKKYSNLTVIRQKNLGVTKARLNGVKAAKGNWIGFIDGDDVIEEDMYERLMLNVEKYGADISHCGYQINRGGKILYFYNTGKIKQQDCRQGLADLICGTEIEPSLCNKLFRRSLFNNDLFDTVFRADIKNYEDLLMNFYLFRNSQKAIYEDYCPYHYISRNNSASTDRPNDHLLGDPLVVLNIIASQVYGDDYLYTLTQRRICGQLIFLSTHPGTTPIEKRYKKESLKTLRKKLPTVLRGENPLSLKLKTLLAATMPKVYYALRKAHKH